MFTRSKVSSATQPEFDREYQEALNTTTNYKRRRSRIPVPLSTPVSIPVPVSTSIIMSDEDNILEPFDVFTTSTSNSTVPSQGHGRPQPQTRLQYTSQPQPSPDRFYEIPTTIRSEMADMVNDIPALVPDVIQLLAQNIQLLRMPIQHPSNIVDATQGHGGSVSHHIPQPLDFNVIQQRLSGYHEELTELFPTHSTHPLHNSSTNYHSLTTDPRIPSGIGMSDGIDYGLPLFIKIDMSQVALTTILYHNINGNERVIHHTYIPFTAAERNLPAGDREFLSIMSSLHTFREWIMGHSVTIITANTTTMTCVQPDHTSTQSTSSNTYSQKQHTNIDSSQVQCYRCYEPGHSAWECPAAFNGYLDSSTQYEQQLLMNPVHLHQTARIQQSNPDDTSIVADNNLLQPELNSRPHVIEPHLHNHTSSNISRLLQTCQSMLGDLAHILHVQHQSNPNYHYCTAANTLLSTNNVNVCNNVLFTHDYTHPDSSCDTDPASGIYIGSNPSTSSRQIPQSVRARNKWMHSDSGHSSKSSSVDTTNGYVEPIAQLSLYTARDVSQIECYRCLALGHYALHCPTRLHSLRSTPLKPNNQPRKFRKRIWRRSAQVCAQSSARRQSSEPIPVSSNPANHISRVHGSTHVLAGTTHNNQN